LLHNVSDSKSWNAEKLSPGGKGWQRGEPDKRPAGHEKAASEEAAFYDLS